jgi:tryptophan-rich sensory protein
MCTDVVESHGLVTESDALPAYTPHTILVMDMNAKTNVTPASVGILVAIALFVQVTSASSALLSKALKQRRQQPQPVAASAPPGATFAIVWPILYILASVALWLQVTSPSAGTSAATQWTGVALMAAQLALGFAWMPVFSAGYGKPATWLIVGMLVLSMTGIVFAGATNGVAAALWMPYIAWLIFALLLSSQTNVQRYSKE